MLATEYSMSPFQFPFKWGAPVIEVEKIFPRNRFKMSGFLVETNSELGHEWHGEGKAFTWYVFDGAQRISTDAFSVVLRAGFCLQVPAGAFRWSRESVEIPKYMMVWNLTDIFPAGFLLELDST